GPSPWCTARARAQATAIVEHYDGGKRALAFGLHHLDRDRGIVDAQRGLRRTRCNGRCRAGREQGERGEPSGVHRNFTSAIQLRLRRARRDSTPSPSNETGPGLSIAGSTFSNAFTLTTAYVRPSRSLVTTG